MGKNDRKESPKKAKINKRKERKESSQSDSSSPEPEKRRHSKQGKLNPKKPFAKITEYESEDSLVSGQDSDSPEIVSTTSSHVVNPPCFNSIGVTGHNVLLACIKNKSCLSGVDFIGLMAKKQGLTGGKGLKGNDLKRHLTWKEQMLIISKLALTGSNMNQMKTFLESVKVHLSANADYVQIAADIVATTCNILRKCCFMENVDNGVFSEYFNRRFADLRNRRNYEAK